MKLIIWPTYYEGRRVKVHFEKYNMWIWHFYRSLTYTIQQADQSISIQDRAALSNTVTHGNANDIAAKVMAIKQTRKEVEKKFLKMVSIQTLPALQITSLFCRTNLLKFAVVSVGRCCWWNGWLPAYFSKYIAYCYVTADSLPENFVPKLGLIYSILMQERYHKPSLVQRVLAIVLKYELMKR